jgi:hypothetical protein
MVLGLKKSLSKGPVGLAFLPTMLFPFKREYPPGVQFPFRGPRPLYPRLPPDTPRMFWKKGPGKIFRSLHSNIKQLRLNIQNSKYKSELKFRIIIIKKKKTSLLFINPRWEKNLEVRRRRRRRRSPWVGGGSSSSDR